MILAIAPVAFVSVAVKEFAASVLATVQEVEGKVIVVASVPLKVRVLEQVNVLPLAIVKVAEVAGAVRTTLLIEVAVATPKTGVTNVGEVAPTIAPEPVFVPVNPCTEVVAVSWAL